MQCCPGKAVMPNIQLLLLRLQMAKHFLEDRLLSPSYRGGDRVTKRGATCPKSPPKLVEGGLGGILKLLACSPNTHLKF